MELWKILISASLRELILIEVSSNIYGSIHNRIIMRVFSFIGIQFVRGCLREHMYVHEHVASKYKANIFRRIQCLNQREIWTCIMTKMLKLFSVS